ncbi:MAG: ABC transporter substrate-binding protein [Gemmatimonadaceae bacterium]|nr:ABC transporter substrate-binding protein [Gemmatimonadaceae bacterium]
MPPLRRHVPALIAVIFLAACGGGDSGPPRRAIVDSRDTYDPRSFDPALSTDVPTGRAVGYVFEGLTRFSPDAQVEPALASSWTVSPDGRIWRFTLRQNVKFHDGTAFTARHVVGSFTRVLDPKTRGGRGWPLFPIAGATEFAAGTATAIRGLRIENDSTIEITLTEPFAIFPKLLAMPVASIVPSSVPADFGEKPVGTGPWKLAEWKHDDFVRFVRNETYWGEKPVQDTLVARIIPELSTAVAEFESGNVDLLYIPEAETRQWEQTEEKKGLLQAAPVLRLWYVAMNTTRGPLADARVRRAINHAIDTRAILTQLLGGRGRLAAGVIPPALEGADTLRAPYAHDVAKARALLTEAGFPGGITLRLWCSQDATQSRVAQAIQGYLKEAGITAELVQRESASMREAARKGEADLVLKDWYADYPDAENFLYPLLHSANAGVGGNVSFFRDPAFDSVVTASRRETDLPRRIALYQRADSIAFAQAPMVFLFFYNELYAVQPWLKNWTAPTIFNGQRMIGTRIDRAAP